MLNLFPFYSLLPLLWLNTLFANQLWSPSLTLLGHVFYWCSLLMAAIILRIGFRRSYWSFILIVVVLMARISLFLNVPGMYSIYVPCMLLLFLFAGVALIISVPNILYAQVKILFILSKT